MLKNPIFLLLQFYCTSCYYLKTELVLLTKSSQLISVWSACDLPLLLCLLWGHTIPTPELLMHGNHNVWLLCILFSSSSPQTTVCMVMPLLIT